MASGFWSLWTTPLLRGLLQKCPNVGTEEQGRPNLTSEPTSPKANPQELQNSPCGWARDHLSSLC
eukprot:3234507-Amphidinium_carterae.1